jgi:hypothetical protein
MCPFSLLRSAAIHGWRDPTSLDFSAGPKASAPAKVRPTIGGITAVQWPTWRQLDATNTGEYCCRLSGPSMATSSAAPARDASCFAGLLEQCKVLRRPKLAKMSYSGNWVQ